MGAGASLFEACELPAGKHKTVSIESTTQRSVVLEPGLYSIHAAGSACHVVAGGSSVEATTDDTWLPAGGGCFLRVNPDLSNAYVATIRSGSGSGTLHLSKHTG
jgi:hypothetical protein